MIKQYQKAIRMYTKKKLIPSVVTALLTLFIYLFHTKETILKLGLVPRAFWSV